MAEFGKTLAKISRTLEEARLRGQVHALEQAHGLEGRVRERRAPRLGRGAVRFIS